MPVELPAPAVPPEEARRAVDEVLSRPEYADLRPGLLERVLQEVLLALGRLLDQLGGTAAGRWLGIALLVLLIAAVGWLVVRFARGTRRDPGDDRALGGPVGRSARDWDAEAGEHARRGDHRQALRCRYRALIASLAEARIVEEIAGRTAGEYRVAVAQAVPGAAQAIDTCTELFERVWYGDEPADVATLETFEEQAAHVRGTAGLPRPLTRARG